ncbi:class I SAM-dependent methyltransferase [Nocardia caishijiensis]|uniref:Methyltransferase family protein n=1 Tax=Nocardia caishijiensis TaxID=184756 RepID=A0ABQ6YMH0_9NOCA|nr:class I SAM-dependent methyltransferase [Nocardia caishijiensis]KAF0846983.1 methyltransferase family protein [Nocardia caishijiensis]
MTTFGHRESLHYDRRATRLLTGLYRRISADVDTTAAPGATVLDLGTGPGKLLAHIATRRPDLTLHGLDLSPHMIDIARHNLTDHRTELTVGDVTDLPYPDASIDLIVSSLSMHEWPDLTAAFSEIHRVLRPGATATVYDFRFARTREIRHSAGRIDRENIRLPWYPVALVTRYRLHTA